MKRTALTVFVLVAALTALLNLPARWFVRGLKVAQKDPCLLREHDALRPWRFRNLLHPDR